jgi:hypothetical protein
MKIRNRMPMYEGDGFIHAGSATAVSSRWEAVADLLGGIAGWMHKKSQRARSNALDDYLARASSLADIERRLREIERDGRFFPG